MLELLKPFTTAFDLWPPMLEVKVKSAVSGFEQDGHEDCPREEEKSMRQTLQKRCPHDVTWHYIESKDIQKMTEGEVGNKHS